MARGLKKPGWPSAVVIITLVALRALRKTSPSGVKSQTLRSVTMSQNCRSRSRRLSGRLPAMIAALIAPIETPEIQSGSTPASCRA